MAEKRVNVRYSATGGQQVKSEAAGIRLAMGDTTQAVTRQAQAFDDLARKGQRFDMRGPMQQLSQVAQQGQATGNYLGALAIQLPDMAMAFGPVGMGAAIVAGALLPLAANLWSTTEASEAAEEQAKALDEAISSAAGAIGRADAALALAAEGGAAALEERYVRVTEKVRELARELAAVEVRAMTDEVGAALQQVFDADLGESMRQAIGGDLGGLAAASAEEIAGQLAEAKAELATALAEVPFLQGRDLQLAEQTIASIRQEIAALEGDVANAGPLAEIFTVDPAVIDRVRELAETIPAAINDGIADAAEASAIFDMTTEMRGLLESLGVDVQEGIGAEMLKAADIIKQAEGRLRESERAADDLASGISEGADQAERLMRAIDSTGRRMAGMNIGTGGLPAQLGGDALGASANLLRQLENPAGIWETPQWDTNALRIGYSSDTITRLDAQGREQVQYGINASDRVTQEDAERDLRRRIREIHADIIGDVGGTWDTFSAAQKAALTSIAYNYGSLGAGGANIMDTIATGNDEAIARAIESLSANPNRRAQEAALFRSGDQPIPAGVGNTVYAADNADAARIAADALAAIDRADAAAAREAAEEAAKSEEARKAEARALEASQAAYDSLVASMSPMVAAQQAMAQGQDVLNDALAAGLILPAEYSAALDDLTASFNEDRLGIALENIMGSAGAEADAAVEASRQAMEAADSMAAAGASRIADLFGSVVDGSASAKEAVGGLLMELAKVQIERAFLGMSDAPGGLGSLFGALGSAITLPEVPTFDGGGYTGSGSRSGGLDGKGGFPAIIHPDEVILDLTRTTRRGAAGGGDGGTMKHVVESHVFMDDITGKLTARSAHVASELINRNNEKRDRAFSGKVHQANRDPRARGKAR